MKRLECLGIALLTLVLAGGYAKAANAKLTPEQGVALTRANREWRYLESRAKAALERQAAEAVVTEVIEAAREVQHRCTARETAMRKTVLDQAESLERSLGALSARINRSLSPEGDLAVSFAEPYSRLAPDALVPDPAVEKTELHVLAGEYQAAGVVVANCLDKEAVASVTIEGLPADQFTCQVRRQSFVEEWYNRAKSRIVDPLGLLPGEQGTWKLTLAPGEVTKLYLSIHCLESCSDTVAKVRLTSDSGEISELRLGVRVAGAELPPSVSFGHVAFMYPAQDRTPEATAVDLGSHGVTMMEFTHLPPSKFSKEGELIEVDFTRHEAWIEIYGRHVDKMLIFWQPFYPGLVCGDGETLESGSETWRRAVVNVLRAFLERMSELGYGMDRFAMVPYDEIASAKLENAPDQNFLRAVELIKLLHEEFPDLDLVATVSYYSYPKDVEAMAPYIDVAMPHVTWPTKIRTAPPSYNPREAFNNQIWPILEAERRKRGLKIWNYCVSGGKAGSDLFFRAYGIHTVGAGQTGIGTWAYNVAYQSTWSVDYKLDYIFVYDGSDENPLNKQLNPTGESVVPSIRWEALRAGIQDARLLLYLKDVAADETCPPNLKADIELLFRTITPEIRAAGATLEWDVVRDVSRRARQFYARSRRP